MARRSLPDATLRRPTAARALAALATTAAFGLAGCAHLDGVRAYGVAASRDDSYATAAAAYRDSAVDSAPYLLPSPTPPLPAMQPAARARQVRAALTVRSALDAYFATLAKLAGADNAAPTAQIDRIGKNLKGLSSLDGLDAAKVGAATDLVKQLAIAVVLPQQVASVRRLVEDGGPSAMALIDVLREVLAAWRAQMEGDRALVVDTLEALSAASDAPPLAVLLARDRVAALRRADAARLRSLAAADLALQRIAAGHVDLANHLGDLSSDTLVQRLLSVVADLKAVGFVAELETP